MTDTSQANSVGTSDAVDIETQYKDLLDRTRAKIPRSLDILGDKTEGVKHDTGKTPWHLIPWDVMPDVLEAYSVGARKYDERNWELGMNWSRVWRALMGHSTSWFNGERNDQEDGQRHLASVVWCALALMAYEQRGKGTDDRPKTPVHPD